MRSARRIEQEKNAENTYFTRKYEHPVIIMKGYLARSKKIYPFMRWSEKAFLMRPLRDVRSHEALEVRGEALKCAS